MTVNAHGPDDPRTRSGGCGCRTYQPLTIRPDHGCRGLEFVSIATMTDRCCPITRMSATFVATA